MRPAHGLAMHPHSAVAMRDKDAAPIENSRDVPSKHPDSLASFLLAYS